MTEKLLTDKLMTVKPWEPLGDAMMDYFLGRMGTSICVKSSIEADRYVSLETFFRENQTFPTLEKDAFHFCKGKILDAGAGSGPHALYLQEKGFDITGIDISEKSVEVMQKRGLKKTVCADIFNYEGETYDTILMMMNGIGIAGDLPGLSKLLQHFKKLLNPGGQILFDSTDIGYVSSFDRSLSSLRTPIPEYYGTAYYQLEYKGKTGEIYPWLFIDRHTLTTAATENGYKCSVLKIHGTQFLARLEQG